MGWRLGSPWLLSERYYPDSAGERTTGRSPCIYLYRDRTFTTRTTLVRCSHRMLGGGVVMRQQHDDTFGGASLRFGPLENSANALKCCLFLRPGE